MVDLLTAAQMRNTEEAAIQSGRVTGLVLMERAGRGVVEAILARGFATRPHAALVLCGPGNNGGDGYVIARLLHQRGWNVAVAALGRPGDAAPDARAMADRWAACGAVQELPPPAGSPVFAALGGEVPDVIVDALFGTGLTRPLPQALAAWFSDADAELARKGRAALFCAVDIPSGLCADAGRWLGDVADAHGLAYDLTVTFHRAKTGHVLAQGAETCGALTVVDIGLPSTRPDGQIAETVDRPEGYVLTKGQGHKFEHGHALVMSGGAGRTGAARLAARGALRMGAGLVTMGVPGSAQMEVACQITSIMLQRAGTVAELSRVLDDDRINAIAIGPGFGTGKDQSALLAGVLQSGRAAVLDADALTLIGQEPELRALLHDRCVLTPHGGEFARICPDIARNLSAPPIQGPAPSRIDAARAAAGELGCTILLKGPDTVIAAPDGQAIVNVAAYERAAPWLATAGAGDVLTGFITGLLARGMAPARAAANGAWLHAECARAFGPGLIAEDLPEILPKVLGRLGAGQATRIDAVSWAVSDQLAASIPSA